MTGRATRFRGSARGRRTIYGYWWKGTVTVYWYRSNHDLYTKALCVVPTWHPFTGYKTCDPSGA